VILSGTFDQDLTGEDERERVLTVARVPTKNPARACRGGTPAMFRQVLDHGDCTTGIRETRRARKLGRRCRLRPEKVGRIGWRRAGRQELRVHDAVLDLLQRNMNRGHEEVRSDKRMRMG
jgi:hypothetical protein